MNEQLYKVSANPHVRDKATTHSIMLDVIIALLPATLFGFYNFGLPAVITTVISIATCVIAEYLWQRFMGKKISIKPATRSTILASDPGWFICDHRSKTGIWWSGSEFYEPCTGCTLFLITVLHRKNDSIYI